MSDNKIITFNSPKNILGSRKLNSQKYIYKSFEMTSFHNIVNINDCLAGNINVLLLCAGCCKVPMQKKPVNI